MKKGPQPSFILSITPIIALLATLIGTIIIKGADTAQSISYLILLGSAILTIVLSSIFYPQPISTILKGIKKSATQILPAIPV